MTAYRFLIADVFSDQPFGGNQLAVLPDARGISDEGLQAIAREFNFPESSFILPSDDPACIRRVRIFTPAREMPFAGHPTVGTASAMVREGIAAPGSFALLEGIGVVRVAVTETDAGLSGRLTVDQSPIVHRDNVSVAEAAASLGLPPGDVRNVFAATLAINFTFVHLRDREAVDRASLDHAAWAEAFAGRPDGQLYVFSGDLADGGSIHSRLFAPSFGIPEDPATGSAASILAGAGAIMTGHQGPSFSLSIDQGVAMGRPSRLESTARLEQGLVTAVEVGGAVTFVAEGIIDVPASHLLS